MYRSKVVLCTSFGHSGMGTHSWVTLHTCQRCETPIPEKEWPNFVSKLFQVSCCKMHFLLAEHFCGFNLPAAKCAFVISFSYWHLLRVEIVAQTVTELETQNGAFLSASCSESMACCALCSHIGAHHKWKCWMRELIFDVIRTPVRQAGSDTRPPRYTGCCKLMAYCQKWRTSLLSLGLQGLGRFALWRSSFM